MVLAPVVLFVYNRIEHLKKSLESLKNNELASESELFIFSDGPKNAKDKLKVDAVRAYLKGASGFKQIKIAESPQHLGLKKSVISGVSGILEKYGKVIVVEDDLLTSPNFLVFMNKALDFYKDKKWAFSISGFFPEFDINSEYSYDTVIFPRPSSWGWATWDDRWNKAVWSIKASEIIFNPIEFLRLFKVCGSDLFIFLLNYKIGRFDSWWIEWVCAHFKNGGSSVFPLKSKVQHIGSDGSGRNSGVYNRCVADLDVSGKREFNFLPDELFDETITRDFRRKLTIGLFLKHYFLSWVKS